MHLNQGEKGTTVVGFHEIGHVISFFPKRCVLPNTNENSLLENALFNARSILANGYQCLER